MADEEKVFNNVDNSITKIVTVGRLVALKGYDLAIETAKLLDKKGIQFKWYVIGEGPERDNIEKMIKKNELEDKFILLGQKSNPYPYMKCCDIYVQTSRFEGFGLTIAEAKILNKLIITTNFDTVHNQIVDLKNGVIVDMEEQAISKAIIDLIKNKYLKSYILNHLKSENKGNKEEINKFYELIEQ
mgnify:FL=1